MGQAKVGDRRRELPRCNDSATGLSFGWGRIPGLSELGWLCWNLGFRVEVQEFTGNLGCPNAGRSGRKAAPAFCNALIARAVFLPVSPGRELGSVFRVYAALTA